ncbi:LicD family protein [Defluviitalea raffinosedens]|nr:LicD family protein [Defluviitalea raffinosedens]
MLYAKIKRCLKKNKFTKELYKNLSVFKRQVITRKKRKLMQENGFEIISLIHKSFNEFRIMYFLDFGTLLGIIREKGFISHDLDIDIGVITDDRINNNFIRQILQSKGFKLKYEYIYKNEVVEDSFVYKNIKVDISYYKNDDQYSRCWLFYIDPNRGIDNKTNRDEMNVVELTYSKISETKIIKINGIEMQVPMKPEKLLEEKYGLEWTKPNKNWIYWKAPSATPCNELGYRKVYE